MNEHLFSGLKVLDIATVIAGPVAATMLADFGADVIKVEQPGQGDLLRVLSSIPTTPDAPNNYFWQMDGRNKRSITLNLKTAPGMAVLHRLIAECDVFVTNQPFPVRRSLKLEYEDVERLNPAIVYASLTAYGEAGPDRDGKGFDLVAYWARSGLMDLVRAPGAPPAQALPGMGDHPTAVALYAGIVTALLHRERTGEGSLVETSLLANGLWSAASIAQGGLAGGDLPGYRHRNSVPPVMNRVYETADGRFLQLTMIRGDADFAHLMITLGREDALTDPRFASQEARLEHRGALSTLIADALAAETSDVWLAKFREARLSVNRVQRLEEVLDDPQITVNAMAVPPVDAGMDVPLVLNHPVRVSKVRQVGPKRAPELGEHTDEVLRSLGYDDAEIRALREAGVI